MARLGKLTLLNLEGIDFVPIEIEDAAAALVASQSNTLDVITGDVVVRLNAATPTSRIAKIAAAL